MDLLVNAHRSGFVPVATAVVRMAPFLSESSP